MSFRIRTARDADLQALYEMAKLTGGGFTNLPPERDALRAKLTRSHAALGRDERRLLGRDRGDGGRRREEREADRCAAARCARELGRSREGERVPPHRESTREREDRDEQQQLQVAERDRTRELVRAQERGRTPSTVTGT